MYVWRLPLPVGGRSGAAFVRRKANFAVVCTPQRRSITPKMLIQGTSIAAAMTVQESVSRAGDEEETTPEAEVVPSLPIVIGSRSIAPHLRMHGSPAPNGELYRKTGRGDCETLARSRGKHPYGEASCGKNRDITRPI